MKMAKSESQAREEVQMLKALLDGAYSDLEMAQLTLQNQEQNVNAKIALKVQEESDLWRAKYSRLLKEQSIKAASLEHAKKENIEIKHKLEQVENEKRSAESMYLAVKQDFDSLREQLKAGDAVMNKALENAWIGRQDAESELVALKSKQQALMEELNSFRGNASMTDSAKNKALENAWTVLQETMDELAVIHRLVEQLRQEKETQKVELHRNFENEVNKWRRDYSKLLQSQSAIMTELHHVQSDNHALREELDNLLGQSKVADAVKSKALENAWVGRQDAQKELAFANQLIDAMRKQVEKLQDLADQREKEAAQVAEAASSLAKLQRDFEAETSSKQAALVERNKELENKVRELQTLLEEKTVEYQESVNSQLLEAEDKWWKQLSSARSQRSKNILSTKNTEIEKLNKDVEIMSSEVAMLRVENERLVARLDERHGEIVALSSGTESFVRLHEDFKISAEKQIHYLNQRVSDTEALLDRKEKEIGDLQDLLKTKSNEWNALLREETAKLNKDCMKMLLDRENQCQSQVAAATYATMATIDAVQQDLRHAHEQLYRITEQNKRTEAKVISQNSQLKNCSTSLEEIMREKNALNEQHGIHLQQAMSEVDELQTILLEKNDELALLQTTLGEIVDETELLVEKAAFETAAKWQQDLLQAQQDCQTRCSRAAALEETQEQLRDAIETLETSNLISRELKESLDHCRLESGQLSDTSSRLTILHEKCQRQITESEMKFKLDIDDIETSARKRIESITVELVGCQDKLNESGSVCAKSLSTGQQECRKEIESVKKLSEQEISVVKKTGQANLDKHLDMAAEALEKAKRQASECRRDLDRLSVAAQGLSKFQIIVDERATEVQNSVSAQLEVVKAELDRKDKLVKELTHQLQIDSVDTEDRIRDLEESCSQKLSWLENSNHMKIQSLEESRDSALRELKLCSEESSDVKSEVARLRSVITEMSEENELLDLKNQQKEKKVQEMNTQLLQKEELFNSIVTQNDELEKNCQSAIRAIEEQKGMEIKNEQKRCSRAFSKPPSSLITIPNESGNCGIKVETESSMTQKLWTLFGHNSEAYDEQRLEAAIEQRTIEWKRKFQDLENKSTALLRETEEALKICYNYGEEKAKNLTVELGDFCQTRLNEQETRYNQLVGNIQSDLDNAAQEKQRLAVQLVEAEAAVATKTEEIKHCSKSVEELLADKEHMSGIIVDLRTHHEDFLMKASKLEAQLLETQKEMKQKKMVSRRVDSNLFSALTNIRYFSFNRTLSIGAKYTSIVLTSTFRMFKKMRNLPSRKSRNIMSLYY